MKTLYSYDLDSPFGRQQHMPRSKKERMARQIHLSLTPALCNGTEVCSTQHPVLPMLDLKVPDDPFDLLDFLSPSLTIWEFLFNMPGKIMLNPLWEKVYERSDYNRMFLLKCKCLPQLKSPHFNLPRVLPSAAKTHCAIHYSIMSS